MDEQDLKRKLATIMVADIVGFSRLTANDEDWTIRALAEFRGVVDGIIARHDGRIFNTGGDSVLAEFASPVEAVRCAVDFQEAARSRNLLQPRDRQLRFRIGINLGDVMVRGDDLLGDGVNVAARLEGLAEHGGICVSGTVWDHIQGKLSIGYVDIGEQSVKNIPRPVRAYHLRVDGSAEEVATAQQAAQQAPAARSVAAKPRRGYLLPALIAALLLVIVGGGSVIWALWPHERARLARAGEHRGPDPARAAAAPATAAPPSLLQSMSARLAAVVPGLSEQVREDALREYANRPAHKALAVSVNPPGYWNAWGWPTRQGASGGVLEGCQVRNGHACALIAVDDEVQPAGADGKPVLQSMPRAGFSGSFDPAQIPFVGDGTRQRTDIVYYSAVAGPKAASYHPQGGRIFIITKGNNQHEIEEEVLKICNDDSIVRKYSQPCFLYSVGDRVVLPLRLTEPLTAAAK